MMKELLSVNEAATELNISRRRVQALITAKKLPAEKIGSYYVIKRKDLKLVENRTVGRPPTVKK